MSEQNREEWGERRRRREEERQRRLAAEREAAAATATPEQPAEREVALTPAAPAGADTPPARTLSRRELRERAAAAAAAEAESAAVEPAPSAPVAPVTVGSAHADPTPAMTPPVASTPPVEARPQRSRSRRELRAATSETEVAPTVVPPALTGGIRRISPDGSLGGVEPTPTEMLSAQVRADALRAQASRAQAEREEAAQRGVERSQAQRAATQRADAERAARERAQRFAEQLAQQKDAATSLPSAQIARDLPARPVVPVVSLEPDESSGPIDRSGSVEPVAPPVAAPAPWPPTAVPGPVSRRAAVPSASEAERQARERADEITAARAAEIARDRAELIESERLAHESVLRAERERASNQRQEPSRPIPSGVSEPSWPGALTAEPAAEEPLPAPQWAVVPRPETGPTPAAAPGGSGGVPVPRWSAIRPATGSGQAVAAPTAPAPGVPSGASWSPAEAAPVPAAVSPFSEVETGDQELEDDGPPARVYTWFHIAALAVVAFVLGLLIVMVLLKDNNQPTQKTSESVGVSVPGPHAADLLPLRSTGI